jgi:PTH1 family peptidyl-tRNA hydrolase
MRLIVGLGNPGPEYQWTPHNLGFLVVDELANRASIRVERPEGKALAGRGKLAGVEVLLAKPQTMMNLSGFSVRELLAKYELEPSALIMIYDEAALPWGTLRIRERGSAGGHNGMKSVIGTLGTDEFIRVRLGVQPDHAVGDLAEYVLRRMKKVELEQAAAVMDEAADAVELILAQGVAAAMNRYNRRDESAGEDEEP